MSLVFERIQSEGIAALSYLVGDDSAGVAAVFDPVADVGRFLALAREKRLAITRIFETHVHADFMSGARELCERAGSATIHLSHEGDARYDFGHEAIFDGDTFTLGDTRITVRHTPGHTPEHVSFLLAEKGSDDSPWGILTGDSLFTGSAGRPDLLGNDQTETLVRQLHETLHGFFLELPDGVMIFPAHGHGSPCGAEIGDRLQSTIGHERGSNPYLLAADFARFREQALGSAPPVPAYYPRMKRLNAAGPPVAVPAVPALPAAAFQRAVQAGTALLVDTRDMFAFGAGHVAGALNIGGSPMLSLWAGWLLDPDRPLLLVLEEDTALDKIATLFRRTGYTRFAGYLAGGMKAWVQAGLPLAEVGQMTVHEVKEAGARVQVVDVRSPEEWRQGHVPEARHCFLPGLREKAGGLDPEMPVAVYCDSGYRASIGASILKQEGFRRVCSVPGSWQAWKNAGLPVEGGDPS